MANILILDDSRVVLAYVKRTLSAFGHEVETAEEWYDIRVALQRFEPDLIMLDVHLPGLRSGAQLAWHLRKKYPNVKIIFYSGQSPEYLAEQARAARIDGYLVKGGPPMEFVKNVERFLPPKAVKAVPKIA